MAISFIHPQFEDCFPPASPCSGVLLADTEPPDPAHLPVVGRDLLGSPSPHPNVCGMKMPLLNLPFVLGLMDLLGLASCVDALTHAVCPLWNFVILGTRRPLRRGASRAPLQLLSQSLVGAT